MDFAEYTTITFPSLGIELNPSGGFSLGPLNVRWYGVIIVLGMLLAVWYAGKRAKEFGFTEDDLIDGFLVVLPVAIICARAYYCVFNWQLYRDDPISCLYIWKGGLAIYGAVIGALLGTFVFARVKKIRFTAVLDLVLLGFMIGQCIGRWGNFFNREAFGYETDSFLRMGLLNPATGVTKYYHPTFLYESLWNLVGFIALHFLSKHRKFDGEIALGYAIWYGLGRVWIEGLRTDSLYLGPVRVSQLLAGISCIAAIVVLVRQYSRIKVEKAFYAPEQDKADEKKGE